MTTKTIDQIWDDYLAGQAKIKAEYDERMARLAAARAKAPAKVVVPTVIDSWYPQADYERDSAMGRLTD